MPQGDLSFPFSAVFGMDDSKRAIMCAAVCPRIRTVLIRGGPGSAKTVLSRAAGDLTGRRVVNVPLNVTEEMLSYLRPLVRGEVSVLMNNGVPVHLNLYSEGK